MNKLFLIFFCNLILEVTKKFFSEDSLFLLWFCTCAFDYRQYWFWEAFKAIWHESENFLASPISMLMCPWESWANIYSYKTKHSSFYDLRFESSESQISKGLRNLHNFTNFLSENVFFYCKSELNQKNVESWGKVYLTFLKL